MIKAGKCFCHICGNVFEDLYFKNATKPVGGKLYHKARGFGRRWDIQPHHPAGGDVPLENAPTKIVTMKKNDSGIPTSITCKFGVSKDAPEIEMFRACPYCKTDTFLSKDAGQYDTFVVGLVGGTGTGKSTWMKAISTMENLATVNEEKGFEYTLKFSETKNSKDFTPGATLEGNPGETNYLQVVERKSGKVAVSVLFLDASGEMFKDIAEAGNPQRRLLIGNETFSGADAVIYFESAVKALQEIQSEDDIKQNVDAFRVFNQLHTAGILNRKPVAMVYTHIDEILKDANKIPKVKGMFETEAEIPVCNSTTFGKTSYAPKVFRTRIRQEDLVAKRINKHVLLEDGNNRHGFVVQSCMPTTTEKGTPWNDLEKNMNLMDPLLWVLNALKRFPIPR